MRKYTLLPGLIAVLLAIPCAAEEVVNFKSGQSMPIVSHRIDDGMVHVDLGDNFFMAFPESTIDSIVVAGKNVMLKQSYGSGANRRVPTTAGSYPVQGKKPVKERPLIPENTRPSPIEIDKKTGRAVYRPMGNHPAPNKRSVSVTGNMRAFRQHPQEQGDGIDTFAGTTPMGNRHVIGNLEPRRTNAPGRPSRPQPVSPQPRNHYGGPVKKAVTVTTGASDSDSKE